MAQPPPTAQPSRYLVVWTIFIIVFFLLHLAAKEARKQLGDEIASKTGKDEFGDCLDFGFGSVVCAVKQGSKLYTNNIRATIVERSKQKAYQVALQSALSEGLPMSEASLQAGNIADLAAKAKSKQARRITGPLFAAIWDSLEVLYYGGTLAEVSMRASGTLYGTWKGGVVGDSRLGRVGYLIGTQVGSWAGSKIGLMCYDIAKAIQLVSTEFQEFFTDTVENGENNHENGENNHENGENNHENGENNHENGENGENVEPVEFFPADSADSDDSNEF